MNWDLWRSHGRIFAYWTYLYFSLCLWVIILCPAFLSKNLKKTKNLKTLNNTFKNPKKLTFVIKTRFLQPC